MTHAIDVVDDVPPAETGTVRAATPVSVPSRLTPRQSKADRKIFAAALDILRTRGPAAVNVESVSAASGVAKTTIYRRYENRAELLQAVVASTATTVVIPTDLSARETLAWVLRNASNTIENVVGRGTVAAVLTDEDPEFTALLLEMIRASTGSFRENLKRSAAVGELNPDLDVELAMSILLGVVVAELIRRRPTDDEWVEQVLALLWPAFSA